MRFSDHPERQSGFEKALQEEGYKHGLCKPGCPWQNGIVERSHRTDNEECFRLQQFTSTQERQYYLRLWEDYYNWQRPHMGLGGLTPMQAYIQRYPLHARSRGYT